MKHFSLSANIEEGNPQGSQYIATPNAKKAICNIINDYLAGIHSFTIIGSYGTGKSSFLIALESDLLSAGAKRTKLLNPGSITKAKKFEIVNIIGDYCPLSTLLCDKFNIDSRKSILDELRTYYNKCQKEGKFLLIVIDEFGKVLEHAAKNNPEQELYFMQKFAEFVNVPTRQILLLNTLHQNFSAYAKGLSEEQVNEWKKVKGRFKEITFVEPIEQLLFLASKQMHGERNVDANENAVQLFKLAKETHFVSDDFKQDNAMQLYPMDLFSAYSITAAIQRYGQNERSLFSFLASTGNDSISAFEATDSLTYNVQRIYDYIAYNYYSVLKDAHADSMKWSSIQVAIERAESQKWESNEELVKAVNIIKVIGVLNLFGNAGFRLSEENMAAYAKLAMDIADADKVLEKLKDKKIIRFAAYKERLMLFEGTDIDLDDEIRKATAMVSRPVTIVDELSVYFKRISPVKSHYYQKGTPRFFEYIVRDEPINIIPTGDIDGYVEIIFSTNKKALKEIKSFSSGVDSALIFVYFTNTEDIVEHLYNIKKYDYLIGTVIKKEDTVAITEVQRLKEYEEALLNKSVTDSLYGYDNKVVWIFKGKQQKIVSHRDFNRLLSKVCDTVYSKTPVMNNELFNKYKLSSSISMAKRNYLSAMLAHSDEDDLGFPKDKFPPEKTIYYSLLRNTGLHKNGEFMSAPDNEGFMPLWDASEAFLQSTENKAKKISELIKLLSDKPYKIKQGFLDFWIPTYLFIRRQDFALYDASRGAYMPEVNMEFFDLLQKHPSDFEIKKFSIDGVKLGFFNQYRRFVNLGDEFNINNKSFVETIKPFLSFYVRLSDYAKFTRKFDHESTIRFRDVLAKAKDPEKAFFEDLPSALGFDQFQLKQEEFINQYGDIIHRAIRELRLCYSRLIDRLENRLIEELGLESGDYAEYIEEIRRRLAHVKVFLLTDKQREFYQHVMTEYENRAMWYQSICYTILDQRLDTLRDEQEDKLADDLVYLFRVCEKYSSISRLVNDGETSDVFSFDMVTNKGTDVRTQTYILPEKDKNLAAGLEGKIEQILSGDKNVDVCTLLSILNKKLNL